MDEVKTFCELAKKNNVTLNAMESYIKAIESGRRMTAEEEKAGEFLGQSDTFWNPDSHPTHLDYNWFRANKYKIAEIMSPTKTIGPRVNHQARKFLLSLGGTANSGAEFVFGMCADLSETPVPAAFENAASGIDYAVRALGTLYRMSLREIKTKGVFDAKELYLILDVMNGTMLTPQMAGQQIGGNVADGIALDCLDKKWEIDGKALNDKISKLSLIEAAAIEIWAISFWETRAYESVGREHYAKTLTA